MRILECENNKIVKHIYPFLELAKKQDVLCVACLCLTRAPQNEYNNSVNILSFAHEQPWTAHMQNTSGVPVTLSAD